MQVACVAGGISHASAFVLVAKSSEAVNASGEAVRRLVKSRVQALMVCNVWKELQTAVRFARISLG